MPKAIWDPGDHPLVAEGRFKTVKKFIEGDLENGFSVPNKRIDLYNSVIKKNDYVHKFYSDKTSFD